MQTTNRFNSSQFIGVGLQSDPCVVINAQKVINDFKSGDSAWYVNSCQIRQIFVHTETVFFEKLDCWVDAVWVNHNFEFVSVGDLDVL